MTKKLIGVAAGGAAAVLGAGLLVPILANAQDDSPSPSPIPSASADGTREERHAAKEAELARLLAAELGISQDRVADALEAVREKLQAQAQEQRQERLAERLDQAVEDGTLTQAQADAILEAAEQGVLPGRFGGHRGQHGMGSFGGPAPDPTATTT